MPKLIIKRETPQRFTWQAILFWVLGLLPVALLAGFLTGNLISQWQHASFKIEQIPLLPLAPITPAKPFQPSLNSNLPLPQSSELSTDTPIKPAIKVPTNTSTLLNKAASKHLNPVKSPKKSASPNLTQSKPNTAISQANTKNQQNNRNRPVESPRSSNKNVKSLQTISESPRPTRSVTRTNPERSEQPSAKSPQAVQHEHRSTNDYRLLEQSLGIPLQ